MPSPADEIKRLRERIEKLENDLVEFCVKAKNLPDKNSTEIKTKKQELKDIRSKLQECQQEKERIQKELDEKVEVLEKSNLASEEKSRQIIKLLNEHRKEIDLINEALIQSWANYNTQSDRMINHLTRPCATCQCKSTTVQDLAQVRNWLFGIVFLLLVLLLLPSLPKRKSKSKK
jgi:hypothetical protein